MTGFPEPDREQIRQFAEVLFRHAETGNYAALRAFTEDSKATWRPQLWSMPAIGADLKALANAASDLAWAAASAPENVLFAAPLATFKSRNGAAEKDVEEGLTISIELDEHPERAREKAEDLLGPATVVTASGGAWVDPASGELQAKLHLHWRLVRPARGFEAVARLKEARRRLAALVDADPTGVPPAHPFRWPGSWHRKSTPILCRILELRPDVALDLDDAYARIETAEQVALAAAEQAKGQHPRKPGIRQSSPGRSGAALQAAIIDIASALEQIPNDGVHWKEWRDTGLTIHTATRGTEAGLRLFKDWSAKSKKYDEPTTEQAWQEYHNSPGDRAGAGSLFRRARLANPFWRKPSEDPPPHDRVPEGPGMPR